MVTWHHEFPSCPSCPSCDVSRCGERDFQEGQPRRALPFLPFLRGGVKKGGGFQEGQEGQGIPKTALLEKSLPRKDLWIKKGKKGKKGKTFFGLPFLFSHEDAMNHDDAAFFAVYLRLSHMGRCDAPGGVEYERVLREWHASGSPACVDQFIVARANAGPDGRGGEQRN